MHMRPSQQESEPATQTRSRPQVARANPCAVRKEKKMTMHGHKCSTQQKQRVTVIFQDLMLSAVQILSTY